jgi:MFS family permease
MTATTTASIDSAAKAYVRHRFVRAFGASYMVTLILGMIGALIAGVVLSLLSGDLMRIALLPLGLFVALIVVVAPMLAILGFLGALGDALHRRFTGALLLGLGGYVAFVSAAAIITSAAQWLGFDWGLPREDAPWLALVSVVGAAIGYEILRHGWWQATTSRDLFLAVRGWRTPPWNLVTTFRRQIGLPAFLSYVGKKRVAASLLYFAVAGLNTGLILLLILPMMFGSMTPDNNAYGAATLIVMVGLLAANVLGAGAIVARRADARATALYQNVREWDVRAPIVFLRSFDQDDDRIAVTGGDAFARWPAGVGRSRTLDELLLEHGSPYGPVIAIGDPRDPVPPLGAARVFVPERGNGWQDVVRGLVNASKCVVMCPNTGRGVQWELDLIAQNATRLNVIFLASPERTRADTLALFERLVPDMPAIANDQTPIAAYAVNGAWRVATAQRLSLGAYTAALNTSLQAMFGLEGVKAEAPASPSQPLRTAAQPAAA